MQFWLCPLLAFLCGSIPFGLLIGKARGIDVRQHGSGNIGSTNVLRTLGLKAGGFCLVLDILKGAIPVVLALNLIRIEGRDPTPQLAFLDGLALTVPAAEQFTAQLAQVVTALCAVLGHNYSPWIGFKGGKGIATSAGVVLGLMPFAVLLLLPVFLLLLLTTRYVSVASMGAALALPLLTHLGARFHQNADGISLWQAGTWNKPLFALSVMIAVFAVFTHRSNIRRLLDGTESRLERKPK